MVPGMGPRIVRRIVQLLSKNPKIAARCLERSSLPSFQMISFGEV